MKAKVLAAGTAATLASRCRFTIDSIGGTLPVWATGNPSGQPTDPPTGDYLEADVTFTGLPANNSDFGRKKVTITVDGVVRDQKVMEVYFPRDAKNHPGPDNGISPNWFYYWKNGNICGIDSNCVYDPSVAFGKTSPGVDDLMRLGDDVVVFANDGPVPLTSKLDGTSIVTTGQGKGIQCVAETIQHERHHLEFYNRYGVTINQTDANNSDTDGTLMRQRLTLME